MLQPVGCVADVGDDQPDANPRRDTRQIGRERPTYRDASADIAMQSECGDGEAEFAAQRGGDTRERERVHVVHDHERADDILRAA